MVWNEVFCIKIIDVIFGFLYYLNVYKYYFYIVERIILYSRNNYFMSLFVWKLYIILMFLMDVFWFSMREGF